MVPLWSTFTLCTEVLVSASVFLVIWRGYTRGDFMNRLAFATLAYELLFNVTYMATRELHAGEAPASMSPYLTRVAIFHGIF